MNLRKMLSGAVSALAVALVAAGPALSAPHELSAFVSDYDANKDGEVTVAEFDAGRTTRFAATDANSDGWVSATEYLAEYEVRLDAKLAVSDESAEDKVSHRQREVRQTHVRFGVLDTDKDGKMSKAEYDASGARAFAQQDRNKDQKISAADAEIKTARSE
ncbi:hypothetical protein [Phenylobacterium immobile]|uniref:hypothetical protein n=1 Tax=Phenylobacterium immobile TaxID=21 RepID=UPI000AE6341E|nr:hypothetical protein [Phenylobacterium immobile]